MSQEELFINGDLLRLRRESRGWLLGDLATRACMSVKQIRQLEEGGMSSFYSVAVKATAAKKVAALLGIGEDEVFARNADAAPVDVVSVSDDAISEVAATDVVELPEPATASEIDPEPEPQSQPEPVVDAVADNDVAAEPEKSKTSLWVIVGLFVAALGVAAYLQPKEEPVAEPAPPLQVVPADPADAASAAEQTASSASAPADTVANPSVQKPASAASSVAATGIAPRASAPASASVAVMPAASASSKTP